MRTRSLACSFFFVIHSALTPAAEPSALELGQTIALPGVEGRFDHFSIDVKNKRLFVAALGNNSVEVMDIEHGRRAGTIKDIAKPTGIRYVAENDRLYVASGGDGTCHIYDGGDLKPIATVKLGEDADNVRYDAQKHHIYVGYGGGALAGIDIGTNKKVSEVALKGHPESFQLESKGPRIFVNVPVAKQIAVIDREQSKVIANWPLTEARDNFPMALDEENHRLFVGCRRPAKLLTLDTKTGKVIGSAGCCGDTDDLFYDAQAKRIYLSGGEGGIDAFDCTGENPQRVGQMKTPDGARTAFFAPELKMFFLAVPHRGSQGAEIRTFNVRDVAVLPSGQ